MDIKGGKMSNPVKAYCEKCGKSYIWIEGTIEECPRCKNGNTTDAFVWVGKEFVIDSAHFIPHHEKCGYVHGHTYKITVECFGKIDENGMVIDLHDLSRLVHKEIDIFDHRVLNETPPFKNFIPTCEHIAYHLVLRMVVQLAASGYPNIERVRVKVKEGEGGWASAEG